MLHKLQYITQGLRPGDHYENMYAALDSGVALVQLRLKNIELAHYIDEGHKARELCDKYAARLIINDNPEVAKQCNADAVHVGLDDMKVDDVRKIITDKVIGGTANTFEHIKQRHNEKVDYIGLGPYRFTGTKEKLSPILGLEGYKDILIKMREQNLRAPVYAIGGLELNDIKGLVNCGVYGVAVSGSITNSANKEKLVREINKILNHA